MAIDVIRTDTFLRPDPSRVLLRAFVPGGIERLEGIAGRVLAIPEARVGPLLNEVSAEFSHRHDQLSVLFLKRFKELSELIFIAEDISEQRRLLIGAYFLAEYSLEAAALFNPSIIPHPDQTGLADGALRFILSLRATGEGHISSITFRTGIIDAQNHVHVEKTDDLLIEPLQTPNPFYEKPQFIKKLHELGLRSRFTHRVVDKLAKLFTLDELRASLQLELEHSSMHNTTVHDDLESAQGIRVLALSNHEVHFKPEQSLSERIIFPSTPSQRNGIEDARFVCFVDEDGTRMYYATFTAYDGRVIVPQLVQTSDFLLFRFITLNGPAAENKGMALFPRKINGLYAMLSRQDNENIYLMFSDDIYFWHDRKVLLKPVFPWELVQLGNCGSPIETEAGWLVLSHGVGPMRQYCIGAFLLDRDDPSKVIGRLEEPLLRPNENEREGYVPNVVYTCGALVHQGQLIIPYGLSDSATGFATVPLQQVLAAMR